MNKTQLYINKPWVGQGRAVGVFKDWPECGQTHGVVTVLQWTPGFSCTDL